MKLLQELIKINEASRAAAEVAAIEEEAADQSTRAARPHSPSLGPLATDNHGAKAHVERLLNDVVTVLDQYSHAEKPAWIVDVEHLVLQAINTVKKN